MRCRAGAAVLILLVLAAACTASEGPEPAVIEVWFHQAEGPERSLLEDQVRRFNEQRDGLTVLLRVLSEVSYPQQVAEAAELGELPDLLDVNRTMLAAGAAGPLRPVGSLLPNRVIEALRPELVGVGRIDRELVAVPLAAHVVVLGVDPGVLREERLPVPGGVDDPWTLEELERALTTIAGADEAALQLPPDPTELGVALEALVRSAGGSVVSGSRSDEAGTLVARVAGRWLEAGLATAAVVEEDGDGGLPLVLGSSDVLPDDMVVSPPPDFGAGVASVPTGFAWAVPDGGEHEAGVIEFLSFLLRPDEVTRAAEVTGGAPVMRGVLEQIGGDANVARKGRLVARLLVEGLAEPVRAEPVVVERLEEYVTAVLAVGRGASAADALSND